MSKRKIPQLRAQTESRRAKLSFGSRSAYSIEELESGIYTERQLRQEYSRLRSIASKRFQRLAESEFAFRDKIPYNYEISRYKPLREVKSQRELAILLRDLASVIESPHSTLYGLQDIRQKSVETMQEQGYKWVTEENWLEFSDFMKTVRSMAKGRMFDSERAVDIFEMAPETKKGTKNKNALKKAFGAYLKELDAQTAGIPEVKR